MNENVELFLKHAQSWQAEMSALRRILLAADLDEVYKWRKPAYMYGGENICILQPMKPHLALMFFKGAALPDPSRLLRAQGPNSCFAKRLEFQNITDIVRMEDDIAQFVCEAKTVENIPPQEESLVIPEALSAAMRADPALKSAFDALTPGRKRGYILHFQAAKQPATQARRIAVYSEKIKSGKGLTER